MRSVQCLRTFYTFIVQEWCNCYIHHLYIKSLRKLNKVAIDTKFIALPQILWYFKINFTRCTFYSVASMVCENNSCIFPPLAASVVCFDLFGREQDLSVAYSRERQSPDLTSSNKAALNNLDSILLVRVVAVYRWWGELTAVDWLLFSSDPSIFSLLFLLQGLAVTMTINTRELKPTLGSSPLPLYLPNLPGRLLWMVEPLPHRDKVLERSLELREEVQLAVSVLSE